MPREPIHRNAMSLIPPRTSKSPVPIADCRLARTIDLIGDRWTLLILRSALYGVRRFDDFQAELGCPRTVLSGRLKALEEAGLLTRRTYREAGKRARDEYVLSECGAELQTSLIALTQWGDTWLAGEEPAPISFVHAASRQPVRAAFVDESGNEVALAELRARLRKA